MGYKPVLDTESNGSTPDWRVGDPSRDPIENPAPVDVEPWPVNARKVWLDGGTEHSQITKVTLYLWRVSQTGTDTRIGVVELEGDHGWLKGDYFISPGMMVKRTEETEDWGQAVTFNGEQYVLLNEGYSYYFTEVGMTGLDADSAAA